MTTVDAVDKIARGPPVFHRRLRRPDHHGRRRGCATSPLARKARRGRAGGPFRQPHRPARPGHRGPEPSLVRGQYRSGHYRRPAAGPASGTPVDGGNPRRPGRGDRGGFRGQIHAALVVLGGSRRREARGPAAAQHVGHRGKDCGALGDYRRRQMGRNQNPCRSAISAPHRHGGEEVLALRRERRAASPIRGRAATAADRGGPHRRHERLQRLGGIRRHLCADPGGSSRTRRGQGRTEEP